MSSDSTKVKQKFTMFMMGIAAGYLLHALLKRLRNKRIEQQKYQILTPRKECNHKHHTHDITESDALITSLNLQCHPEGGYFRTTYKSGCNDPMKSKGKTDLNGWIINKEGKNRNLMSCIYWLQREYDSKIMTLHAAGCDIVHYFHNGTGLKYFIVDPILNALMITTLGPNIEKGHGFQLIVPKHCWIAAIIDDIDDNHNDCNHDANINHNNNNSNSCTNTLSFDHHKLNGKEKYALISEACCPGFDFRDWRLITWKELMDTNLSSNDKELLKQFIHQSIDNVDTDQYY